MDIRVTLSAWLATIVVAASTLAAAPATAALAPQAYFVSPTGADSNNGLSSTKPFRTLEKAQTSLQRSSIKTVYLMGGLYTRLAVLRLGAADSGESWLGYPGQTPALDGGSTVGQAIIVAGADHVTIRWLTLQNYAGTGVFAQNVSSVVIDSNTIRNIYSTGWNQGGIVLLDSFVNGHVTHNLILNSQYAGIMAGNAVGDRITNMLIDSNVIYNTCTLVVDCGAIYADDRSHASTGVVINNNVIGQYGSVRTQAAAIYLDQLLSFAKITNNIIYGSGNYAVMINGGDHNSFSNNVFDISLASSLARYSNLGNSSYSMTGNSVSCNIVYSSAASPVSLWTKLGGEANPAVSRNLYWKTSGTLPNLGAIIDTAPTVANPGFVNPAAANYAFINGQTPSFCAFTPINTAAVGPLPNR